MGITNGLKRKRQTTFFVYNFFPYSPRVSLSVSSDDLKLPTIPTGPRDVLDGSTSVTSSSNVYELLKVSRVGFETIDIYECGLCSWARQRFSSRRESGKTE